MRPFFLGGVSHHNETGPTRSRTKTTRRPRTWLEKVEETMRGDREEQSQPRAILHGVDDMTPMFWLDLSYNDPLRINGFTRLS